MPSDVLSPPADDWWARADRSGADFDDLYRAEFPRLAGTLYAMSGIQDLAEDVAQDAFAHAWARWGRVRVSPSPAGWVYTTAFRMLRRRLRLHRRPPLARIRDGGDSSERSEGRVDLLTAVRGLPARQQRVVALRYLVDLSTVEVAEALGMTETAVRSTLHRAVLRLRSDLCLSEEE